MGKESDRSWGCILRQKRNKWNTVSIKTTGRGQPVDLILIIVLKLYTVYHHHPTGHRLSFQWQLLNCYFLWVGSYSVTNIKFYHLIWLVYPFLQPHVAIFSFRSKCPCPYLQLYNIHCFFFFGGGQSANRHSNRHNFLLCTKIKSSSDLYL